jgi:hypothetical protein
MSTGPIVKMKQANFQPAFKVLPRPDPSPLRQIGLGMTPDPQKIARAAADGDVRKGVGALIDWIKDSVNCPIFNMPTIEQVRWGMNGPQTDISISKNFGVDIDLFGSGKGAQDIDYIETTMAQAGQTQTYMLACAIFFHIEPEPMCWTALGNSWEPPQGSTAPGNTPISPDVFTANDLLNGSIGGVGLNTGANFYGPAVLEWGWWANYAAWHLVRGYNMRWKIGQHTNILDEVLRHTAYMPTNAQEGSASNSEVDIVNFVKRANVRYNQLGASQQFLKVNRIRIGSVGGTATTNFGIFRPSNDDTLVGATYGGMDLRSLLRGNSEFRKLTLPYVIKPGVPIGLILQANDTDQMNDMQAYLALTQNGDQYGGGVFPPVVTDTNSIGSQYDGQVPGTNTGNIGYERTFDSFNVQQQVSTGRSVYKGGSLKLSQGIKGFEVSEDWYTILQNNPDLKSVVMAECNVRFAQQGA